MAETPSQEQISALMQEAKRSASAVQLNDKAQAASAFDLRQSRQMSESETRGITALQESFARQINDSLGSYLRAPVEMKLVTVEQKTLSTFTKDLQEPAYVAALRFPSLNADALLQIGMPLVFQTLDLMFGGDGKQQMVVRELTVIEEEIFESAIRVLCDELRSAWQPVLATEIRFDRRVKLSQIASLMPASEKLLLTAFDVTIAENQGKLAFAFPAAVATALTRDLAVEPERSEPVNSQKNRARLQELLANCSFEAELMLPPSSVSVREIFGLKQGSIIVLNVRATEPIQLNVAGKNMFLAMPVGCGAQRGAEIERILTIAPDKERK
ncbi:MAG TPA: flagellar motor switch protein FliM [Candidatus Acidoferrales bacterium]|nr:flagellar motor switch protein FliM [Candidatus Acidoferrales bacterium]